MAKTATVGHTPGPWHQTGGIVASHEGHCAVAAYTGNGNILYAKTLAEREANARLIAAAPDLLAALEAMQAAFVRHPGNADERHHALTLTEAALAKAEA